MLVSLTLSVVFADKKKRGAPHFPLKAKLNCAQSCRAPRELSTDETRPRKLFFAQRSQKTEIRGNAKEGERPACPRNPSRKDAKAQRKTAKPKEVEEKFKKGEAAWLHASLTCRFIEILPAEISRQDAKAQRKTAKSKEVKESFKGEKRHGSTLRLLAALLKSFPQKFPARTPRRKEKPRSQRKLKKVLKGRSGMAPRFAYLPLY